ncbi:MAG TPA: phage/plasmid primase, P4 family [Ktedonobacteraceae bacterium]|nr:phage/plasmid primase, P4 family [Ktedonobacteraceae bacterium]
MKVREAVEEYQFAISRLREQTQEMYRKKLTPFIVWCEQKGIELQDINQRVLRRFVQPISTNTNKNTGEPITPVTVHGYMRVIKAFLNWCTREEDFDTDATLYLLNTRNTTIDLRTMKSRKQSAQDMITKSTAYGFEDVTMEKVANSRWVRFIDEITCGDKELARYLQKCAGYSMTGDTSEQSLFICYGNGCNGKSVFLEVIRTILGEYATTIPIEALLAKRDNGISHEIAGLKGYRFVTSSESDRDRRLSTGLIKHMTGSEMIRARHLYQESFEFTPQAHLWISTNHKPDVPDDSTGMWRRLKLVPFNASFLDNPDKGLMQTLLSESDVIMKWLLTGCHLWQRDGIQEPEIVLQAIAEYRKEQDPLNEFFEEKCIIEPEKVVAFSELYDAYKDYAGYKAVSKKALSGMLKERGYKNERKRDGMKLVGIGLTELRYHF